MTATILYNKAMKKKYISSDPKILGGMPVIVGTRVPIARILYLVKQGETLESVQTHFPHVSLKTLQNVLDELAASLDTPQHGSKTL